MVAVSVKAGAITNVFPTRAATRWRTRSRPRARLYALTRSRRTDQLAAAVLDSSGAVSQWWPSLLLVGQDPRAILRFDASSRQQCYGRGFAARGWAR
jgi:hypothetical protein